MDDQLLAAIGMGVYVMVILFITKFPYEMMVKRGMEHIRAVYYNRKIVHMMAGGIGSFSVPLLFEDYKPPRVMLKCGPKSISSLVSPQAHLLLTMQMPMG